MLIFFSPLGAFSVAVSTPFFVFKLSDGWHCGKAGVGLVDVGADCVKALMVVLSGTPAAESEPPANDPVMTPPTRLNEPPGMV